MPRFAIIARDPLLLAEAVAARIADGIPIERHHVSELSLDDIFSQLCGADLFADRRALHYIDFLSLKPTKKEGERLATILERVAPHITLACSQLLDYGTRAEERRALSGQAYKLWTTGITVDDLRAASEGQRAVDWLFKRASERYALVLNRDQIRRLLDANDERPALVDCELRKLWMLKADDQPQPVSGATLDAVLSVSPGARFYQLVDAVMAGAPDALSRLAQWYKMEPKAERLLGELRRRLLGLLALQRGEPIHPQSLAGQLRAVRSKWPPGKLSPAIQRLAALEYDLKSGAVTGASSQDAKLSALQLLVVQLGTL